MYPAYSDHQFSRPAPLNAPPPLSIPQQSLQQQQQQQTPYNGYPAQQNIPPPSPSQSSEVNEEATFNLPGPPPISRIFNNKAWALEIVQQPIRARMCGFGDKDRRPISPPPCVRLIIIDVVTKEEVNYEDYAEQLSKFVLHVDLCSLDTLEEKNLVRHSSSSPSISSVATTSYPVTMTNALPTHSPLPQYNINNIPAYNSQTFAPPPSTNPSSANAYQAGGPQQQHYHANGIPQYGRPTAYQYHDHRHGNHYTNGYAQAPPPPSQPLPPMQTVEPMRNTSQSSAVGPAPEAKVLFTRNLIGSLSASAFKLEDLDDKIGLFFVFQDLSIRTEGWFRLKMSFFDIGDHSKPEEEEASKLAELAPLLASIYSKPFRVYSAKRFPGVIESTELSKKFATQGIKIPIRKDASTGGKRRRDDDSDGEDQDDDD